MACVAAGRRDGVRWWPSPPAMPGSRCRPRRPSRGSSRRCASAGEPYVDADWVAPLPVRLARSLGAQRVLAVDATAHMRTARRQAPSATATATCASSRWCRPMRRGPIVLLHPDFGYWVSLSREFRERAIAAGYRDTMAQASRLQRTAPQLKTPRRARAPARVIERGTTCGAPGITGSVLACSLAWYSSCSARRSCSAARGRPGACSA